MTAFLTCLAAGTGIGCIVGSFLASVCYRLPADKPLLWARSHCDGCQSALRPYEMIPIASFLVQRGRCRSCGVRIDSGHLAIEIVAGAVGAIASLQDSPLLGAATALFGWMLIVLAVLDFTHFWLPDSITFPLLATGLAFNFALGSNAGVITALVGALAGYASLQAVAITYKRFRGVDGLGGGDPKLFAAIGAWVGWASLPFVLLGAAMAGLAYTGLQHINGRRISASHRLPFGTMLAIAAWPAWLMLTTSSG